MSPYCTIKWYAHKIHISQWRSLLLTLIPVDTSAEMKMNEMTLTDCRYEATSNK